MNIEENIIEYFRGLRDRHRKPQASYENLVKVLDISANVVLLALKRLAVKGLVKNETGSEWAWTPKPALILVPQPKPSLADSIEINELRKQVKDAAVQQVVDQRYEKFIGDIANRPIPTSTPWLVKPRSKSGNHQAVPTVLLSDTHFDEVIDPAQINGVNAYNRVIARERLTMFFNNTVKMTKEYWSGLEYPGLNLPLLGDNFSGNIHDELKRTNADSVAGSLLYWIDPMKQGIRQMADEFGKVYLPCVVGNHGRNTPKPISKGRVRDNWDWLFYQILAREMAGDKRVTFAISESPDFQYSLYNTKFYATHGDQFRGGAGISGLLSPMMIGDARKRKRAQATNQPYDYMLIGHFHQFLWAMNVLVNGSLKGYDEWAALMNFGYEPPQQAIFLTSPERKLIWNVSPMAVTRHDDQYSGQRGGTPLSQIPFATVAAA